MRDIPPPDPPPLPLTAGPGSYNHFHSTFDPVHYCHSGQFVDPSLDFRDLEACPHMRSGSASPGRRSPEEKDRGAEQVRHRPVAGGAALGGAE
jgi:hypothetical protein